MTLNCKVSTSCLFAIDAVIGAVSGMVGMHIAEHVWPDWRVHQHVMLTVCLFGAVFPLVQHAFGFHNTLQPLRRSALITKSIVSTLLTLAFVTISMYVSILDPMGRKTTIVLGLVLLGVTACYRLLLRFRPRSKYRILIYAKDNVIAEVKNFISKNERPLVVVEAISHELTTEELFELVMDLDIDEVVTDNEQGTIDGIMLCLAHNIPVTDYIEFIERYFQCVPIDTLRPAWLLSVDLKATHPYFHIVSRWFDIMTGLVGLLVFSPVMAVFALLTRAEGKGTIFYTQVRVGRFGKPFRIWKLRSMKPESEKNGAQWAQKDDVRVTRVGKIMRKARIDELPQFWNILKGDMSLIGPRPERPEFVAGLTRQYTLYNERHLVRPGLSGLAQINAAYAFSEESSKIKLSYDLYYIKHRNLLLDIQIILQTISAILPGSAPWRGAR